MGSLVPAVPFDYETCRRALYRLKQRYTFLRLQVIGRSLAGRAIFGVRVGCAPQPVLLAAGFHANEWMTSLTLVRFLEALCGSIAAGTPLCGVNVAGALQGREVLFVPCVNPDGVQIAIHGAQGAGAFAPSVRQLSGGNYARWTANAAGVDINHNFDAGWQTLHQMEQAAGITGPAPRQYGGPMAQSEPETAAIVRLTRNRRPRHVLALHSQGEEIYWQYGENKPAGAERLARIFAAASGYTLIENAGLASHGGYKDWVIAQLCRPAYTIEIGKGKNPLPLEEFARVYASVEYLLTLASVL